MKKLMKTALIAILAALAIGAGSLNAKVYFFNGFSADFPSQPEVVKKEEGQSRVLYSSYTRTMSFSVIRYDDSAHNYSLKWIEEFTLEGDYENGAYMVRITRGDIQGYPWIRTLARIPWHSGRTAIRTCVHIFAYPNFQHTTSMPVAFKSDEDIWL